MEESGHVRKEMASRYVQYLVDLHVGLGNFVEAGMAQLYQLKMLEWTDGEVESQGLIPAESERARKVILLSIDKTAPLAVCLTH